MATRRSELVQEDEWKRLQKTGSLLAAVLACPRDSTVVPWKSIRVTVQII
jgi:hypothetical protein